MANQKNRRKSTPRPYYKRHWGSNERTYRTRLWHHVQKAVRLEKPRYWWSERSIGQKILVSLIALVVLTVGSMYGIAQWYIHKHADQPTVIGTTFVPRYARYFGLDPKETLHAILYDAGIRDIRLVSYWDEMEKSPGQYDFSELDWQFKMAEETNSRVSLAIGLRQPRWPECHIPKWAEEQPMEVWAPQLKVFMGKVIDRYKDSPALDTYQLENEFFLKAFGDCPDFSRDRLIDEYNFVKAKDPYHPVIITRSNNAVGIPVNEPTPDKYGVSIYKRVWDKTITKRYFEYPFPAWFYGFLAGAQEITQGKDMIIHELQAEPWVPSGYDLRNTSIAEQDKSMNATRLAERIEYGKGTGMKEMYLWGAEWWYWRKVHHNDPSLWNTVKATVQETQRTNAYQDGDYIDL